MDAAETPTENAQAEPVDCIAWPLDPLERMEAKLDHLLAGQGRVDALVEQAGPALAELGGMAERMAAGGIMGLLKPAKR